MSHHLGRDLVLDRKDVVEAAIVCCRPQVRVRAGVDELRGDAHPVAGLPHRTLEHVRDIELLGDLADLQVLASEGERRGARDHPQFGNVRQQVQELLGDAVGKVLVVRIAAHVDEWQYNDGILAVGLDQCFAARLTRHRLLPGRIARGIENELVEREIGEWQRQQQHDQAVEQAIGALRQRAAVVEILLALDALRREFEGPCQDHRRNEADQESDDDGPHGAAPEPEGRQDRLRDLDQQP